MNMSVEGQGPLIVCMPGMGDLRESYRFVVPRLVEAGYRVATMDLRGLGGSPAAWPSYKQTDMGGDLLSVIRELGGPAVVVAHSFTPDAAVYAAVQEPRAIVGTVLLGPWANRPEPSAFMRLATKLVIGSPWLWGLFYRSLYPGRKPADFDAYLKKLRANLREPGRLAAFAAIAAPEAVDAHGYRPQMKQPSLVVMGSRDPDFKDPAAEARAMAAALSSSECGVVMIDGAGHYPHAQYPEETAAAILEFCRQLKGSRSAATTASSSGAWASTVT